MGIGMRTRVPEARTPQARRGRRRLTSGARRDYLYGPSARLGAAAGRASALGLGRLLLARPRRPSCRSSWTCGLGRRSSSSRPRRGWPRARPSGPAPPRAPRPAGWTAISSPAALRSISSSTCSRYSSWYLSGSKSAGQRLDQLLGHRQLALGGLGLVDGVELVEAVGRRTSSAKSIVAMRQHVARRADRDELLLGADDDARDRDLARLAHRVEQQPVGLGAAGAGREVVGVVVVDRVDLVEVDEVLDVDRPRLLRARAPRARRARSRRSGPGVIS